MNNIFELNLNEIATISGGKNKKRVDSWSTTLLSKIPEAVYNGIGINVPTIVLAVAAAFSIANIRSDFKRSTSNGWYELGIHALTWSAITYSTAYFYRIMQKL